MNNVNYMHRRLNLYSISGGLANMFTKSNFCKINHQFLMIKHH